MAQIQHFLLVFDHSKDKLVQVLPFGSDTAKATEKYGELERKYRDSMAIDIVLVGSDSLDTVRVTHANYFEGMSKVRHDLAHGLLNI